MQVILVVAFILLVAVAIFYWFLYEQEVEKNWDINYTLECLLDEKNRLSIKTKDYDDMEKTALKYYKNLESIKNLIYIKQRYNSDTNTLNEIKTLLEELED